MYHHKRTNTQSHCHGLGISLVIAKYRSHECTKCHCLGITFVIAKYRSHECTKCHCLDSAVFIPIGFSNKPAEHISIGRAYEST